MANTTGCPTNSVPATLPIPQNITYVVIPDGNTSDLWMASCCQPNPVQVVNDCWQWCAVPAVYTNGSVSPDDIAFRFDDCFLAAGRDISRSNGLLIHIGNRESSAAASRSRLTLASTAVVALTVSVACVLMV
ncbi:hypothetical protein SCUCBS95973_001811 [Sporothrix curviconia]|uniref:Uncharacterized protein n=1 Tax=Sporothrix curviconia TaxID=1260050 RepID=A0ABP0B1R5_9PEZI